jgi:ubiquinone/menaquinone biosynthesis C-methylase UbiE
MNTLMSMDEYTAITRTGLNTRYALSDDDGIYYAFQPIYGPDKGHSEPGLLARYTRTYRIMRTLSHLKFNSLLDVGGAEGYTGYVIQKLFGGHIEHSDLSEEACQRAREIFNLKSTPADVQALPYEPDSFDVVLCSETLEHVPSAEASLRGLLKIARKAVVVTLPHEPQELIDHLKAADKFHAHLHTFTEHSFDKLEQDGFTVSHQRVFSMVARLATMVTEPFEREWTEGMKWPKGVINAYNACIPFLRATVRRVWGKRGLATVMKLDGAFCTVFRSHGAIAFVILKDRSAYSDQPLRTVTARDILEVTVPYFYPNKKPADLHGRTD